MISKLSKVQIHPAHHCNLRCIFCDVPVRNAGKVDLDEEKWIEVVKGLCELRPKKVTISGGGEPLLRVNLIMKIMKILNSFDIGIELITNGIFVSDEVAKTIAECCDHYRLSLHSTSIEMDELLRGVKGSINVSLEGVKKIVYWKKKIGEMKPKIDIAMVLTEFNINEIEKMINKAPSLDANMVSLRVVHQGGQKYNKYYPSKKQIDFLKRNLKKYEALANKNNLKLQYDFLPEDVFSSNKDVFMESESQENQHPCMLPFREMVVFSDGRVTPCCNFIYDYDDLASIDSVLERSIGEIWIGEKFNSFRKRILKKDKEQLPEMCKRCSVDLKPINKAYIV